MKNVQTWMVEIFRRVSIKFSKCEFWRVQKKLFNIWKFDCIPRIEGITYGERLYWKQSLSVFCDLFYMKIYSKYYLFLLTENRCISRTLTTLFNSIYRYPEHSTFPRNLSVEVCTSTSLFIDTFFKKLTSCFFYFTWK